MRRNLLLMTTVVVAAIGGCALPLWLLPSEDTPVESPTREVGPLIDTGVRPRKDAGTDSGLADTRVDVIDSAPASCVAPLPDSFACEPVVSKVGETICTDAMLDDLISACFGSSGASTKCGDAKKKYPECAACALDRWIHNGALDVAACVRAIDATSSCAETVRCTRDCLGEVCGDCNAAPGSGGPDGGSEWSDCEATVLGTDGGTCTKVTVGNYGACASTPRFAPCFVRTVADVVVFLRGACRDGGSWTSATGVADAGPDVTEAD